MGRGSRAAAAAARRFAGFSRGTLNRRAGLRYGRQGGGEPGCDPPCLAKAAVLLLVASLVCFLYDTSLEGSGGESDRDWQHVALALLVVALVCGLQPCILFVLAPRCCPVRQGGSQAARSATESGLELQPLRRDAELGQI